MLELETYIVSAHSNGFCRLEDMNLMNLQVIDWLFGIKIRVCVPQYATMSHTPMPYPLPINQDTWRS